MTKVASRADFNQTRDASLEVLPLLLRQALNDPLCDLLLARDVGVAVDKSVKGKRQRAEVTLYQIRRLNDKHPECLASVLYRLDVVVLTLCADGLPLLDLLAELLLRVVREDTLRVKKREAVCVRTVVVKTVVDFVESVLCLVNPGKTHLVYLLGLGLRNALVERRARVGRHLDGIDGSISC